MINEHTYAIGMTVISWLIAIFMLLGFELIRLFKEDLEDDNKSDSDKEGARFILEGFYNENFTGKVVWLLNNGAYYCALIFTDIISGGKWK